MIIKLAVIVVISMIIITDKNNEVIYKERFNTDTIFDVYKDEKGNTIYNAIEIIEDGYINYLMEDKHKLYYR